MYAFTVQSTIIYIRFLLDYWILLCTYHVHYVNYICHDLWFCSEQISFLYFTYSVEYIDKISNTCFSITMDLLFPFTFSCYFFPKIIFLFNWISIINYLKFKYWSIKLYTIIYIRLISLQQIIVTSL